MLSLKTLTAPAPTTTQRRRARPHRCAPPSACARCGAQLLTAEQAATLCQYNRRLIYRWVEQGALDFDEAADGVVWVCSRTLLAAVERLQEATARLQLT